MDDEPIGKLQLDEAHRNVGRFLYHFAKMELSLDGLLQKALDLNDRQARILSKIIPLAQKVNAARSIVDDQVDRSAAWKAAAIKQLSAVSDLSGDRNMLAHAAFDPSGPDAVQFRYAKVDKRLSIKDPIWLPEDFKRLCKDMDVIREKLDDVRRDLTPIVHEYTYTFEHVTEQPNEWMEGIRGEVERLDGWVEDYQGTADDMSYVTVAFNSRPRLEFYVKQYYGGSDPNELARPGTLGFIKRERDAVRKVSKRPPP